MSERRARAGRVWQLSAAALGCALACWMRWSGAPVDEASHPHPITAEHRALQRELQLIAALNDALDLGDAAAMRPLIARYAGEYPADTNALQAGYHVIAACLEERSAAAQDAARDYYERERASTLRRYVRRACLEDAPN